MKPVALLVPLLPLWLILAAPTAQAQHAAAKPAAKAKPAAPAVAAAPTITGFKRTFSDDSQWSVATNQGTGTLTRTFSDGSQWQLKLAGRTYTIRRTFSDDFAWSISDGQRSLSFKTTYGQDPNEWDFGTFNFKTDFKNDFKGWGAYGFSLHSSFSDRSSWTADDKGKVRDPLMKLGMVFVAITAGQ